MYLFFSFSKTLKNAIYTDQIKTYFLAIICHRGSFLELNKPHQIYKLRIFNAAFDPLVIFLFVNYLECKIQNYPHTK